MIRFPFVETGSEFTLAKARHSHLIKATIESRFKQNDGGRISQDS